MVDEPDQPGAVAGASSPTAELAELARAQAAGARRARRRPGRAGGDRVSHNAARLLIVVLRRERARAASSCPINFRLNADEVALHRRALAAPSVLLVDPELDDAARRRRRPKHRFVLGAETDAELFRAGVEPEPWDARRGRHRHHQLHERHHRPAQGRAAHPPQPLAQRRHVRLARRASATATSTCTRCRCSTATAGACRTPSPAWACHQVVLRKVDGAEILRRVERHGVTLLCGAPGGRGRRSSTPPPTWDGPIPGRGPHPHRRGRRAAADPHHRAGRDRARLGVHPDLRPHRDVAAAHDEPRAAPSGTTSRPASGPQRLGRAGRAGARRAAARSTTRARCWPAATSCSRATGSSPRRRPRRIVDGWFHTGDGGALDDERYLTISDRKKDVIISGGENVSSIEVEDALFSHPAVAEVAVIGVPDEKWGETVKALVVLAPGATATEARAHRPLPRPAGPLQVPDVGRVPRRAGPHRHRQAAEVQAARARTGRAASARSTDPRSFPASTPGWRLLAARYPRSTDEPPTTTCSPRERRRATCSQARWRGGRCGSAALDHRGAVAPAGRAGGALDRARHAHRGDHPARRGRRTGALTDATPGLPLGDALDPARRRGRAPARGPGRPSPGRAAGGRPTGTIVRSPWGDSSDCDAHPPVAVAHVELHALARLRPAATPAPGGRPPPAGTASAAARPRPISRRPEGEPAVVVAPHQPVGLERHGQPVGGGPGEAGGLDQLGQRAGPGLDGVEHGHRLVEHADAAYAGSTT